MWLLVSWFVDSEHGQYWAAEIVPSYIVLYRVVKSTGVIKPPHMFIVYASIGNATATRGWWSKEEMLDH